MPKARGEGLCGPGSAADSSRGGCEIVVPHTGAQTLASLPRAALEVAARPPESLPGRAARPHLSGLGPGPLWSHSAPATDRRRRLPPLPSPCSRQLVPATQCSDRWNQPLSKRNHELRIPVQVSPLGWLASSSVL